MASGHQSQEFLLLMKRRINAAEGPSESEASSRISLMAPKRPKEPPPTSDSPWWDLIPEAPPLWLLPPPPPLGPFPPCSRPRPPLVGLPETTTEAQFLAEEAEAKRLMDEEAKRQETDRWSDRFKPMLKTGVFSDPFFYAALTFVDEWAGVPTIERASYWPIGNSGRPHRSREAHDSVMWEHSAWYYAGMTSLKTRSGSLPQPASGTWRYARWSEIVSGEALGLSRSKGEAAWREFCPEWSAVESDKSVGCSPKTYRTFSSYCLDMKSPRGYPEYRRLEVVGWTDALVYAVFDVTDPADVKPAWWALALSPGYAMLLWFYSQGFVSKDAVTKVAETEWSALRKKVRKRYRRAATMVAKHGPGIADPATLKAIGWQAPLLRVAAELVDDEAPVDGVDGPDDDSVDSGQDY